MPKILVQISNECNKALRHHLDGRPMAPEVEAILARSAPIKKAAKELGISLPKRLSDGRGKYARKSAKATGYH